METNKNNNIEKNKENLKNNNIEDLEKYIKIKNENIKNLILIQKSGITYFKATKEIKKDDGKYMKVQIKKIKDNLNNIALINILDFKNYNFDENIKFKTFIVDISKNPILVNYKKAKEICKFYRLPTLEELEILFELKDNLKTIFPEIPNDSNFAFWTSSTSNYNNKDKKYRICKKINGEVFNCPIDKKNFLISAISY